MATSAAEAAVPLSLKRRLRVAYKSAPASRPWPASKAEASFQSWRPRRSWKWARKGVGGAPGSRRHSEASGATQ